jgi:ribonuclease HI
MKYYTDGFCLLGNPSNLGGGYTTTDKDGNLIKQETIYKKGFTNNEGEMLGIINTLRLASQNDEISTDSMCMLSWFNRGKSKSRPDLNEILKEGKQLKIEKNINLMWEGRDFNKAGWINERQGNDKRVSKMD